MTYVALVSLAVALASVLSTAGLIRSLVRQHARERDQILNKLLHLAGRTWEPPPAEAAYMPEPEPEEFFLRAEELIQD